MPGTVREADSRADMKAKISETVLDEHLADLSNQGMDDAQYAEYMA